MPGNAWRPIRLWPLLLLLCLLGFPLAAQAHSAFQGAGDFMSGLFHPIATPSHVMLILGLGLLAGRRAPLDLKTPMTVFVPLAAAALILTTTGWVRTVYPPALLGLALCAGAFLALDREVGPWVGRALFAGGALALGLDSAVEPGSTLKTVKALLGTWISLAVLVCDVAIYVSLGAEAKWLQVALRVAGSWIIAIALLMLAFSLRPA